jgi:hypothetical protein
VKENEVKRLKYQVMMLENGSPRKSNRKSLVADAEKSEG